MVRVRSLFQFILLMNFIFSPGSFAQDGSVREGTTVELAQSDVQDLQRWIENAKISLTELKGRIRFLRGSEKRDTIRSEFGRIIQQSGRKENELLMRYTLNRARLLDDILGSASNPGELDFLVTIYEESIALALELYSEDQAYLAAMGVLKPEERSLLSMPEFGRKFSQLISRCLPAVFDPSTEYRIRRTQAGFLGNDLNSPRNLHRVAYADVILKIRKFLIDFPPESDDLTDLLKALRRMKFEFSEVILSSLVRASIGVTSLPQPSGPVVESFAESWIEGNPIKPAGVWGADISIDDNLIVFGTGNGELVLLRKDSAGRYNEVSRVGISKSIHGAAFLPGGKKIVTSSRDGKLRVWVIQKDKITLEETLSLTSKGYGMALDPTGKILAVGDDWANVTIWDTHSWKLIRQVKVAAESAFALAFTSDGGKLLVGGKSGKISVVNTTSWKVSSVFETGLSEIYDLAVNQADNVVVSSAEGGDPILVFDIYGDKLNSVQPENGGSFWGVQFDRNEARFLSLVKVSNENFLQIRGDHMKLLKEIKLNRSGDWAVDLVVNQQNDEIVVSSHDGLIVLKAVEEGQK